MKRTISWVLALVLVLSLFAGCGAKTDNAAEPTNAPDAAPTEAVAAADENLENAIAYLKAFYKEVKDGDLTPSDFERLGTVRVGGAAYEVVYTVDCAETDVKVVKGSNGMVTIDVNEDSDAEVPYVLTATITGTDGKSASLSWKHVLPVSMAGRSTDIVDEAYALENGEALSYEATLTGEIISVDTPYSADYKNITVTIKIAGREDKPIMCYRLKGEGADALMPGDIITVTGTLKNYKGTIEFDAGCSLDQYQKGENSVTALTDPDEILKAAFALDYGEHLPYNVTLTGKIVGIGSRYSEKYGNVTVTIKTGNPWYCVTCYRLKGDGVDRIWLDDEITVTGSITNYNGTIEFEAGSQLVSWIDNPDPVAPSDPAKILEAAYTTLGHRDTLPYACSLTGNVTSIKTAWSDRYQNISVWMSVPGSADKPILCYRLSGTGAKDIAVGDTITVYGWLKNYNGTIEFDQGCRLMEISHGTAELTGLAKDVKAASELAAGESLSYKTTVLNGVITDTPYESTYADGKGSWKFTVSDGTASVLCYYVPVIGGTPKKGDIITVEGYLTNFGGQTVEFTKSATAILGGGAVPEAPSKPEELTGFAKDLEDAKKLENKTYLDRTSTVTGTVSEIVKVSDYGKNQWDFYLTVGSNTVRCFFVSFGSDVDLKVGDSVTVSGPLTAYNGTPQFDKKAAATLNGGSSEPEKPSEPEGLTGFAKDLEDAKNLANKTYLDRTSTVTGTVSKIVKVSDYGKNQWNFYLSTSYGTIQCYFVTFAGEVDLEVGDSVTISGSLTAYNGTPQFDKTAAATLN